MEDNLYFEVMGGFNMVASKKIAKTLSNAVYSIGVVIFIFLLCLVLFGTSIIPNPDAMIPWSMREIAFVGLAIGAIPMFLACMAVYKLNDIKQSMHNKRNSLLVFLPGFLCGVCLLVVIGLIVIMFIQALLHISSIGG